MRKYSFSRQRFGGNPGAVPSFVLGWGSERYKTLEGHSGIQEGEQAREALVTSELLATGSASGAESKDASSFRENLLRQLFP